MPSYLDAEGSIDGLDEEDLELPQTAASQIKVFTKATREYSSDSDSDPRNMEFDSSHFNRDTSSSDDENGYSKGLTFTDTVDSATSKPSSSQLILTQSIGVGLLSNLSSVGTALIANVLNSVTKQPNRRDSDSDFEIINSDDLNEET